MKNKIIILLTLFCLCLIGINSVEAKVVLKDDIPNSTYVIGKYMFTRTPNETYNYNGELTTPEIMLASKTIDGEINEMIIYYKKINGDWIDGLTGDAITPPSFFEIENRNLRDILPTPEINCRFLTESDNSFASCDGGIILDDEIISGVAQGYGIEYYVFKDSNGLYISDDVSYRISEFVSNNKKVVPTITDFKEAFDDNNYYQIVGRMYYMDGDEKVYSEFSNIVNNAVSKKFNLSQKINLKADLKNVGMYIKPDNPLDITYYNVEFSLQNVDTSKYMVKRYVIFTNNKEDNVLNYLNNMQALDGSNDTYMYLYSLNTIDDYYTLPHYKVNGDMIGKFYVTAEVDGENSLGEYNDVSNEKAYSIRFDDETNTYMYFAELELCDKTDTNRCYTYLTNIVNAYNNN